MSLPSLRAMATRGPALVLLSSFSLHDRLLVWVRSRSLLLILAHEEILQFRQNVLALILALLGSWMQSCV